MEEEEIEEISTATKQAFVFDLFEGGNTTLKSGREARLVDIDDDKYMCAIDAVMIGSKLGDTVVGRQTASKTLKRVIKSNPGKLEKFAKPYQFKGKCTYIYLLILSMCCLI